MTASSQSNGVNNPARRKNENYRLYEHGIAIADLARRTTTLEEENHECKEWREAMMKAHLATDKKLDRLLNRAWGVGKTMVAGSAIFVTSIGAAAWLADKMGMTIHFGG